MGTKERTAKRAQKSIIGAANKNVTALLLLSGCFSPEELQGMATRLQEGQLSFWDVLLEEHRLSEDEIANLLAERLRITRVWLSEEPMEYGREVLPQELARRHVCLPLRLEKNRLIVCMANPADLDAIREVEFHTGSAVTPVIATRSEILAEIERYYARATGLPGLLEDAEQRQELRVFDEVRPAMELDETLARQAAELAPVVRLVNMIMLEGLKKGASDIHIEPGENEVQVRTRIDGLMRDELVAPTWLHGGIVSRIKILAGMDISERRRPQDGHIHVLFRHQRVDFRISTLPTRDGEKVVMRIFGSGKGIPSLTQLGMEGKQHEMMLNALSRPQGMILVTGPTGSGKTTTLYSALATKMSPELNIVSIEDPIEFHLQGINQVQIAPKAGLTFASCLRSILRQDPDVILVGEIRDQETAEVAFHAAMTGHLVLSTLHTNDTLGTLYRLMELGIERTVVASCVNLVIAQRLARRICKSCKTPYHPPSHLLERMEMESGETTFYRGKGCKECGGTGFNDRVGLYEMLAMTGQVQEAIQQKLSDEAILKAARSGGMLLLGEDAANRIRDGVTTVEEALRVIRLREGGSYPCPHCKSLIRHSFSTCPYCMAELRKICQSCRQELKTDWRLCPYCNTAVETPGNRDSERWAQ